MEDRSPLHDRGRPDRGRPRRPRPGRRRRRATATSWRPSSSMPTRPGSAGCSSWPPIRPSSPATPSWPRCCGSTRPPVTAPAIETMGTRVDALRASSSSAACPGSSPPPTPDRRRHRAPRLGARPGRRTAPRRGQHDALRAALDDELIAALLLAHGMHPEPLADRVERVLAACRTTLGPARRRGRAGRRRPRPRPGPARHQWRRRDAALAHPADRRAGAARAGRRRRRPADRRRRRRAAGTPSPTIIPLTSIGRRRTARWTELPAAAALAPGDVVQLVHEGGKLVACRLGDDVYVAPDPFTTNSWLTRTADRRHRPADGRGRRRFAPRAHDPFPTHTDGGVARGAAVSRASTSDPLAALRAAVERGMDVRPGERCEMCGVTIGGDHRHVVDTTERALQCLCPHCFMLFSDPAAVERPLPPGRPALRRPRRRRHRRRGVGRPGRSRCRWRSSSAARPSIGRSPSTPGRPAPPSRCCRSTRGRPSSTATRTSRRPRPTSRR